MRCTRHNKEYKLGQENDNNYYYCQDCDIEQRANI